MLTPAQRIQLQQVILDHIGLNPQRADIVALLGHDAVNRLPAGANGARIAGWVLDVALRSATPASFINLVLTCDQPGRLPDVQVVVQRLLAQPALWSEEVVDELWVPSKWPFVDRRELRDTIAAMADGAGPAAITVEAPLGRGKQTMCMYIDRIASRRGTFAVYEAQVQDMAEQEQLDYLVESLRHTMGLDPGPDTTHQEIERQASVQALQLAIDALTAAQPTWLLVNVLQPAGFRDGLRRFVDELLELVGTRPALARRLRVVLVADDVGQLRLEHLPLPESRFVLPELTKEWITEWFAATTPGRDPEVYELFTTEVLQQIEVRQPAPSERLKWLALTCARAQQKLATVPGG
jgi:hypothetical protein